MRLYTRNPSPTQWGAGGLRKPRTGLGARVAEVLRLVLIHAKTKWRANYSVPCPVRARPHQGRSRRQPPLFATDAGLCLECCSGALRDFPLCFFAGPVFFFTARAADLP